MANNSRGVTVECTACGWQGDESLTDARYCPDCGGECAELGDIYTDGDLSPSNQTPNARAVAQTTAPQE